MTFLPGYDLWKTGATTARDGRVEMACANPECGEFGETVEARAHFERGTYELIDDRCLICEGELVEPTEVPDVCPYCDAVGEDNCEC